MSPGTLPVVPPLPTCSVPALIVVPPEVVVEAGQDQGAGAGLGRAAVPDILPA